jgi:hypothetical protein
VRRRDDGRHGVCRQPYSPAGIELVWVTRIDRVL